MFFFGEICVLAALCVWQSCDEFDSSATTFATGIEAAAVPEPACEGCPRTPTDLKVTKGSGTQVVLEFKDNANNEDGFVFERQTDGASFIPVGKAPTNVSCLLENPTRTGPCFRDSDPALTTGVTYTYRALSYREFLYSNYSSAIAITFP
ncbi:MAG: hypothetical protein HYT87_02285 [Nitrospirae bacterium]|nr:hypothetical protein [Nitrospirota bacterium]